MFWEATERQLQAVRAQAGIRLQGREPGSRQEDFATDIVLRGPLGPEPATVLRGVMAELGRAAAASTGAALQEQPAGERLRVGGWSLGVIPGTDTPSGRIRVALATVADVRRLERDLDRTSITLGGEHISVEVSNPATLPLPGNGGRARSARVGPTQQ